jgi:hypothetical protein
MAMTIAEATIIASTSIPANGTEAAPVTAGNGATVGPFADYGNSFAFRVSNGASAPGSPLTVVFYGVSGSRLYEIDRYTHDTTASSVVSGAVPCPPGFGTFTAKAFGNTSQLVTAEVYLERQVP